MIRREKMDNLVTLGMIERKYNGGKSRGKMAEGMAQWHKVHKYSINAENNKGKR